jgi:endonuclease YncB( thermonuclease family)
MALETNGRTLSHLRHDSAADFFALQRPAARIAGDPNSSGEARMFRRKKPDSGFEWHDYIRTTIKLRRDARRQKVVDARRAAGQQVRAAGVALAQGSVAAGGAAVQGARAGAGALGLAAQATWLRLVQVLRLILRPVANLVARPNIGGPLALAGGIALGAGIGRARGVGLDREAVTTLMIGVLLMASLGPMLTRQTAWRLPRLSPRISMALAGVSVLVVGAAWLASGGSWGKVASLTGNLPLIGSSKPLEGYAYAVGGDGVRLGSTAIRLAGIEAPESEQRCGRAGRTWRCGAAAEAALSRLVGGRKVSCTLSGSDDAGRPLGRCSAGGRDLGGELVRQGHVFAEGGILARYAAEEREARTAGVGVWSGNVERPADYRAKLWEEAKRRSPDGCPIKGQITGSSRVYVLPWSPDYERTRVQRARGERWFCSEQEAVSAGFRAAHRG